MIKRLLRLLPFLGLLLLALPGVAQTQFVNQAFSKNATTQIDATAGTLGGAWAKFAPGYNPGTISYNSGSDVYNTSGTIAQYVAKTPITSMNYDLEADLVVDSVISTQQAGFSIGVAGTLYCYRFVYYQDASAMYNGWYMQRVDNSSQISSPNNLFRDTSNAPGVGTHHLKLQVRGPTYTMLVDGNTLANINGVSDSTYLPNLVGIQMQGTAGTATTGYHLKNFVATAQADPTRAAGGDVMLTLNSSTVIGTAGDSGKALSTLYDGDFTTEWAASGTANAWAGIDLGSGHSAVLTQVWLASASGDGSTDIPGLHALTVIQASNDPTFASGVVTLKQLSKFPIVQRYKWNKFQVTPTASAYRCFRVLTSGNYGNVAELRFFGEYGASASTRPAPVSISPAGGRYPNGNALVTLSCPTTGAAIYYTTDGSAPSTSSTLYTGAFFVTPSSGGVTVKAIAYDATLFTTTSEVASSTPFKNSTFLPGDDWYDDDGYLIQAGGGAIISTGGKYYWFGAFENKPNQPSNHDIVSNAGVWCYSSSDLFTWHCEGEMLDNAGWSYIERPHVVYNASTNQYVMWAHGSNYHDSSDRAMVAVSDSPNKNWVWINPALNPDGLGYKDSNLFVDDDGKCYVIYTNGNQDSVYISQLASDYLSTTGTYVQAVNTAREAPVLFKHGSNYFLITGVSNYYDSTITYDEKYVVLTGASNPLGTWPTWGTNATALYSSDPTSTSYNAQSSSFIIITGKINGYFFLSDRWNTTQLYTSRQVWLPITFPTSTTIQVNQVNPWDLSYFPNGPFRRNAEGRSAGSRPAN